MSRLLHSTSGDGKDKLMPLTREICALKLSESHLLAALSASAKRADAAFVVNRSLQAALKMAEAKMEALQVRRNAGPVG